MQIPARRLRYEHWLLIAWAALSGASSALAQPPGVGPLVAEIDGYTLRANAISSTSLPVEMTDKYGIARDVNSGVLNIVVQRGRDATAPNVPAAITGWVEDAAQRPRPIDIRAAVANQQVSYIGTFLVTNPGAIHEFSLRVRPGDSDREHSVRFRDRIGVPR